MLEQEEYKKEGVDWNEIKFVDNQAILVCIIETLLLLSFPGTVIAKKLCCLYY